MSELQATPQERYAQALDALGERQRRFVVEYLRDLRQRAAAIRAGYSERSADSQASQLLKNPKVFAAVQAGMDLQAMPEAEILARLTRIARTSIADVLRLPAPQPEREREAADAGASTAADAWSLDLVKAQETGAIDVVKSIKEGKYGPEVELYSAHEALRDLAKIRGMTIDRKEISGPGGGAIPLQSFEAALGTAYADDDTQPDAPDGE